MRKLIIQSFLVVAFMLISFKIVDESISPILANHEEKVASEHASIVSQKNAFLIVENNLTKLASKFDEVSNSVKNREKNMLQTLSKGEEYAGKRYGNILSILEKNGLPTNFTPDKRFYYYDDYIEKDSDGFSKESKVEWSSYIDYYGSIESELISEETKNDIIEDIDLLKTESDSLKYDASEKDLDRVAEIQKELKNLKKEFNVLLSPRYGTYYEDIYVKTTYKKYTENVDKNDKMLKIMYEFMKSYQKVDFTYDDFIKDIDKQLKGSHDDGIEFSQKYGKFVLSINVNPNIHIELNINDDVKRLQRVKFINDYKSAKDTILVFESENKFNEWEESVIDEFNSWKEKSEDRSSYYIKDTIYNTDTDDSKNKNYINEFESLGNLQFFITAQLKEGYKDSNVQNLYKDTEAEFNKCAGDIYDYIKDVLYKGEYPVPKEEFILKLSSGAMKNFKNSGTNNLYVEEVSPGIYAYSYIDSLFSSGVNSIEIMIKPKVHIKN